MGIGIVDKNFIFYETHNYDSPGPCFSPWIGGYNLEYIDLEARDLISSPYTITEDKKISEEKEVANCMEDLNKITSQ